MTDTEQPIGFHLLVIGCFCTLVLDRSGCDGDDSVARASQIQLRSQWVISIRQGESPQHVLTDSWRVRVADKAAYSAFVRVGEGVFQSLFFIV